MFWGFADPVVGGLEVFTAGFIKCFNYSVAGRNERQACEFGFCVSGKLTVADFLWASSRAQVTVDSEWN